METVFRVNTLRPTLRDRPQLSQRDDRLIESLVEVRLTNGPFTYLQKNIASLFIQKKKKHLLPIFSPDLTVYGQIWLFCAQKWIFSERLTPFIKAGMNKSLEQLPHRSKDEYVSYSLTKSVYLSYTYNSTRDEILILSYSRRRKKIPLSSGASPHRQLKGVSHGVLRGSRLKKVCTRYN